MTEALPPLSIPKQNKPFVQLTFIKMDPKAILPKPGREGDVACDVYALEDCTLNRIEVIRTGLQFAGLRCELNRELAEHSFIKVESRSGLASRGVFATGGIIDNTYRGELKIILNNINDAPFQIKAGDRIAQLVIYLHQPASQAVEVTEASETNRGTNGFGSTGA
jgi:dUTP pyrophosphatase